MHNSLPEHIVYGTVVYQLLSITHSLCLCLLML